MIGIFGLSNIKEEYKTWKSKLNEIFKQTIEARYWPLTLSIPRSITMLFVILCCIIMIIKEVISLPQTSIDSKVENSMLTMYLVFAIVINSASFLNTLVVDNSTGIWVKVTAWVLEKLNTSEELILNITIVITILKSLEFVNGGITEGFLMKNEGNKNFESQHCLNLIMIGFSPIKNWLGHAFYSDPQNSFVMYSAINKTASLLSSFITLANFIERFFGKNWTYTKELLSAFSLGINMIQLCIIVSHAIILIINEGEFASIKNCTVTKEMSIWMLFYSGTCLGIISCRGNNILSLMGMYSPLLIVFVTIYCWDHVMEIGLDAIKRET